MKAMKRACVVAALGAILATLVAFTNAPPTGVSGAPGEGTCANCHNTYALNSGSAGFSIFAPSVINPGTNASLVVAFTGSNPTSFPLYGFEITARDASGAAVGSWQITDPTNTQAIGSQHVGHTQTGTTVTAWTMDWVPPVNLTSPTVTFYASGVQANGGNGNNNDYVYTTSTTVPVALMALQVTSTNLDLSISLTGQPTQAGHEYWVLPTLNAAPGPILGLTPDFLTTMVLFSLPTLPGLHFYLDGSGSSAFTYPPGTVAAFQGQLIRFAAFAVDPLGNLSGFSDVAGVTP